MLLLLLACTGEKLPTDTGPVDADGDGSTAEVDCDDADASVHPGATEECNGHDDDCDRQADEGVTLTFYADGDGDGYGTTGAATIDCEAPAGMVADATDCDDTVATVHPGATEDCNGVDDNCDGIGDVDYAAWYVDADLDGYGDPATAIETCTPEDGRVVDGTDCDDADAAVNPGAVEVCDLDDDNCDGRADLGVEQEWHTDTDGDGYGHMYNYEVTCDPDPTWVLDDTDCRPGDAEAFPGAAERCNGDDDDCDTLSDEDFDLDGDGEWSTACDGGDCDDLDPEVNTSMVELCEDGLDNDCDDGDARCGFDGDMELSDAELLYSDEPNYDAGRLVEIGDLDGDGHDDMAIATMYADGYNGGAVILPGPITEGGAFADLGYRVAGSRITYAAGRSMGIGDVDGDGQVDLALGAPDGTEKEWIVFGPITAEVDLADGEILYVGSGSPETGHGSDLADVNGDGIDDAIIGAYEDSTGGYAAGTTFVDYGPIAAGEYDVNDLDARLIGDAAGAYSGRYVRAGGDVDGDGVGDILLAAPYASVSGPYSGGAHLVYGGVTGDYDLASADGIFLGESAGDYAGEELAFGDIDGDGLDDVVLGSYDTANRYAGAAYVVYGPASGTTDLGSADVILRGDSGSHYFGMGLAVADADADGEADLLVGAIGDSTNGASAGAAFLYFGPVTGTLSSTDADASLFASANDTAGESVGFCDLDEDGLLELWVGAPTESTGGSSAGAVYLQVPQN
jgi:hypothetical protein